MNQPPTIESLANRTITFSVSMPATMYADLIASARDNGKNVSEYIRDLYDSRKQINPEPQA